MSAQSEIRHTGETKERSDAINRIMKKYEVENFKLQLHVAKLHQITCILVIGLGVAFALGAQIMNHYNTTQVCEQQSYVQPQPTHKKGGLEYTLRP